MTDQLHSDTLHTTANNTQAAVDAGRRIGELEAVRIETIEGVPHAIMPEGLELTSLKELLPRPPRLERLVDFIEVDGFCEYVQQFATPDGTRIYRDDEGTAFCAVLDDHEAPDAPRWTQHRAALRLCQHESVRAWAERDGAMFGHVEFVEFLQERLGDIVEPAAADLLSAARTFSAHRRATFDSVVPEAGGNLSVAFSEEVRGQTKSDCAELPERLTLRLRPWQALPDTWEVQAVVRWRFGAVGQLTFGVKLLNLHTVLEDAEGRIREAITERTGLPVLA